MGEYEKAVNNVDVDISSTGLKPYDVWSYNNFHLEYNQRFNISNSDETLRENVKCWAGQLLSFVQKEKWDDEKLQKWLGDRKKYITDLFEDRAMRMSKFQKSEMHRLSNGNNPLIIDEDAGEECEYYYKNMKRIPEKVYEAV